MTKRTRIYTRTGDDGTTGLVGGSRIKKYDGRIEAYGTIDELSCAIGQVRASLLEPTSAQPRAGRLDAWLSWIQDRLFDLGSDLATPSRDGAVAACDAADIAALERAIDEADLDLPPLAAFILPGGTVAAAQLQIARAVCRRAERLLVRLREAEPIAPESVVFVNRLSDALFVWSRWINAAAGRAEPIWNKDSQPPAPA